MLRRVKPLTAFVLPKLGGDNMFELIKIVIENIFGMIDFGAILNAKKSPDMSDIGVELLHLYVIINNLYVTGNDLMDASNPERLRTYFKKWEDHGWPQQSVDTHVGGLLTAQCKNIRDLRRSLGTLSATLAIVDPKTLRELGIVVRSKSRTIFDYIEFEVSESSENYQGCSTLAAHPNRVRSATVSD
jgi:hypothetical protein